MTVIAAVILPLQVWIAKEVIDQVVQTVQTEMPSDWDSIILSLGGVIAIWAIGSLSQSFALEVSVIVGRKVENYVAQKVLRKASMLDLAFYEMPSTFDKLERALKEAPRAYTFVVSSFHIFSQGFALIGLLAVLFFLHPLAVVILLITSIPQALLLGYYADRWWQVETDYIQQRRMASYIGKLLSSREAVKEVRIFGLGDVLLGRYTDVMDQFIDEQKRVRYAKEKLNFLLGFLSIGGAVCVWIYSIFQALAQLITVGQIAMYFSSSIMVRDRLNTLVNRIASFYEHGLFTEDVFQFLDIKQSDVEGCLTKIHKDNTSILKVPTPIRQGFEFQNVSFRYPGTDKFALKNLSFSLCPGDTVAVVGANGAGKTTLVKLIARFYDPVEGVILLDGKDLREYDIEDLRRQIGVIFQDYVRYDLTAQENIGFGQVDELSNLEHIKWASKQGGASDVVARLPNEYKTVLGKNFDDGVELSGGEWQKVALSRAFARRGQVVILDEPTASLDAIAEYELYRRLSELTKEKTTLFISHRFSTVRSAQHIIVLDEGGLIEEGTHDELITNSQKYAEMFNLQASQYI